ncbi:FKBP-type peptidyl-prolyl cis-trans isomerase [Salinimicrobium sp. GXAS 041]|uniref:FKBP-type peptidyl-prolyl cis-trans isomerase n=1 Tax=Salinimicrobium sp. GXAS 041 TaxID=3400806 RepID=UPI003C76C6E1
MRLNKILLAGFFMTAFLVACDNDDDSGTDPIPERDRGEQEVEDREALEEYLSTHFYNYEDFENPSEDFDNVIRIDTINEANADKTPLSESNLLEEITVSRDDVDYTIYVLKVREGEGEKPTFADSTFVTYRGQLLDRTLFDNAVTPVWFDLTRVVPGFSQGVSEFRGASSYEVNPDNSVTWSNDYGIGAVFMPSGLGYFSTRQGVISPYSPLVFTFKLYLVNEADHDNDGIPSYMEDVNNDENIANDDTDEDLYPNYIDEDDDGDFIPTREEIIINEETGEITFPDSDNDGTPDYLDGDV